MENTCKKPGNSGESAEGAEQFIARQPILNRVQRIHAYELLFRSGLDNCFSAADGDEATSKVIANSFLLFGINTVTGGAKAFINFTRRSLLEGHAASLPPDKVVVEVLESVEADEDILAACRELKKKGYALALDDFVYDEKTEPLVEAADIIKVDFMISGPDERKRLAEKLIPKGLIMLAEKVETHEEYQQARDLGYSLFQGYFFSKPVLVSRKDIPASKLALLRMLAELNSPEMSMRKLSGMIEADVGVSYKLLTYINSAAFGVRQEVTSIQQALGLMGEDQVRKWASLMALGGMAGDKPAELVVTSAVRAKFCELLAPLAGLCGREGDMFLMGLFSLLDAIFGRPLEEVLDDLALADDVRQGLLEGQGLAGLVLALALAHERGDWQAMEKAAKQMGVEEQSIPQVYSKAIEWQQQTLNH